jgi:hypothetical protein
LASRTAKTITHDAGLSIGKNGIVMCAGRTPEQCGDSSQKDDPADLAFNPAKGEPYRLALVAGDDRVSVVIVPDPITGKHKGCTLSVERLLPRFELAYFRTGCHRSANANHKQFELDSAQTGH